MKSLKLFSVFLLISLAYSFTASAQTYKEKKMYYKGSDGRIHHYTSSKWNVVVSQKESTATTTDSTLTYIDTITVANNESGILEVQMIGYNDSLSIAVTGKKIVRYKKVGGTLTLGSITDILATEVDTDLQNGSGGSTWTIVAASNEIYVRIKGKVPYNIYWECLRTKQKKVP
jgi:hypothetical protein